MVFKPDQQKMQQLLSEAITVLCKNGLNYESHVNVEALIGITLDDEDVFLVSVRDTIQKQPQSILSSPTFSQNRPRATANRKRPAQRNTFHVLPDQTLNIEPTVQSSDFAQDGDDNVEPPVKKIANDNEVITIKGEQSDEDSGDTIVGQSNKDFEQNEEDGDDGGGGGDGGGEDGEVENDANTSQFPHLADSYGTGQLDQFVNFDPSATETSDSQIDSKAAVFANQAAITPPLADTAYSHQPVKSQPLRSPQQQFMSGTGLFRARQEPSKATHRGKNSLNRSTASVKAMNSPYVVPFSTAGQADLDSLFEKCYSEVWKCSVCGTEFKSKERLKIHMRGHFGQLNHRCSICHKKFWKKEDLNGHVANTHTNEKLYHCRICGNFFSYKRSLRLHLKKVHHTDWRDMPNS